MKRFYLLFSLLSFYFMGMLGQPSVTNIPNPFTDESIIQSTNKISLYGVSGKAPGAVFNVGKGDANSVTPYGGAAGVYIEHPSKSNVTGNLTFTSITLGSNYKYIYFVFSKITKDYMPINDWDNVSGSVSFYDIPGNDDWKLGVVDITNKGSLYSIMFQTDGTKGYVANVCLTDQPYTIPSVPAPTDQLTPPDGSQYENLFSLYSNKTEYINTTVNWTAAAGSQSNYNINEDININCRKATLNPQAWGGNVQINLPSVKDISEYTHIHFDLWLAEEVKTDEIRIELYPPVSEAEYQCLRRILPSTTNTESWIEFDWKISDFSSITYGENPWTTNQLKENFERFSFTAPGGATYSSRTFYIDNVYFYSPLIDTTTPQAPAYLPPVRENENVLSIFSNSYANGATIIPEPTTINVAGNDVWKFENVNNFSLAFAGGIEVPDGMTHLHIDVWTETANTFTVNLNGTVLSENNTTQPGEWLRLNVPVSAIQGRRSFARANAITLNSLGITSTSGNITYFIDNVYFYKEEAPVTAGDIVAFNTSLRKGINMGDIFDFDNEVRWNPEYLQMVADSGFSHVRLPVCWENYGRSLDAPPYNINPEFISSIQAIVDRAIAEDLKIIVNMHHHEDLLADPSGQRERFISQWEQIAEYFQNYPDNLIFELLNEPNYGMTTDLWNEFVEDGIKAIRETNLYRPIMVGVAEGGGLSGLSKLKTPLEDQNLIVTIHYYSPHNFTHQGAEWSTPTPPVGTEWLDTQEERDAVENDFIIIKNFLEKDNRPIHIGEFGVYEKADMDSRVRWTTYIARYIEKQQTYSWAYWDFEAKFGIYNPQKGAYNQPLVDALLRNPMPPVPAKSTTIAGTRLYDSEVTGFGNMWGYFNNFISHSETDNKLTLNFNNNQEHSWQVQLSKNDFTFEQNKSYRVSFKAFISEDSAEGSTFSSYSGKNDGSVQYGQISFSPNTEEREYSYTFTMKDATNNAARVAFDLGKGAGIVTLNLAELIIEELVAVNFEAAPAPAVTEDKVKNIFSTSFDGDLSISFSVPDSAGYIRDTNNKEIIELINFDEQTISFTPVSPANKTMLHINAYAGSVLKLEVQIAGGGETKNQSFNLPSHEWRTLELDLTEFLSLSGDIINSITLSGGTGSGRKLYMDHIFFYEKSACIPSDISFAEDAVIKFNTDVPFIITPATSSTGLIIYSTSDDKIARVDSDGKVTITGLGSAVITASQEEENYSDDNYYCAGSDSYTLEVVADNAKNIWTGSKDNNWNDPDNWSTGVIPGNNTIVYIPGNISTFPHLTEPALLNVCKDIYFMHGAQIGRPDLLTYEKAHVQLNFGLGDTSKPQHTSNDIEDHLLYSAGKSTSSLSRSKWHMLSLPLKKIVTGDLSFGGYPGTFLRKFEASKSVSGTYIKGNWSDYYSTTVTEFQPAEGFIFWMNEYKPEQEKDFWVYKEYNKGVDTPISSSEREYGLQRINGILEFPYYEDTDMSIAHRLHRYYSETGRSSFNGFSGDINKSNYLQMTTGMEWFNRGENDEAYRFIFENNPDAPNVKYAVSASIKEDETKSMLALTGNPYMSTIDFNEFYNENQTFIKPNYHVWTETGFSTYDALTGNSSGIETINQYIAPMQSFLVELIDGVVQADLTFNIAKLSTNEATQNASRLRVNKQKTQRNKIEIVVSNNAGLVHTFIAQHEKAQAAGPTLEGQKIISNLRNIPEIYTIRRTGNSQSGTAYSIVNEGTFEIPLAIATTYAGKTTFRFTGMDTYNATILFIDQLENISYNITGCESFEYEFLYNPPVNADKAVISNEDRFSIHISTSDNVKETGIDYAGQINAYVKNKNISLSTITGNPILEVYLYDMEGHTLFSAQNINTIFYIIRGIENIPSKCIVRIVTEKATKNQKLLIKN